MRIPAVFMRGGTSRGLFFHERNLPSDSAERERVILAAYGSPDPSRRQVDGIGGATANTSKVAIIGSSDDPDIDVTYTFGQVAIDRPLIDWAGNCGNMSAAVGPFAIDEGLVPVTADRTTVRFLNTNTNKVIVAHVPTKDGRFDPRGDLIIPGIPNAGSAIQLDYVDPGGAVTGRVLPTGRPVDEVGVDGRRIEVSLVDAANPLAFVRYADAGLTGLESADDIDTNPELLRRLEAIRAAAGRLAGIADTEDRITREFPSVPKLTLVGPPVDYVASDGSRMAAADMSLRLTMMSMGRMHPSIALTGSICAAVAVKIPGTLAHQAAGAPVGDAITRIGHPAGVVAVTANPVAANDNSWRVDSVGVLRTARRLFEGAVHIL